MIDVFDLLLIVTEIVKLSINGSNSSKGSALNVSHLTLCLLVSSADNLYKQFGPRSGPTKRRA